MASDKGRIQDAAFAAAARTDVPALVAEVCRLRGLLLIADGIIASMAWRAAPGFPAIQPPPRPDVDQLAAEVAAIRAERS